VETNATKKAGRANRVLLTERPPRLPGGTTGLPGADGFFAVRARVLEGKCRLAGLSISLIPEGTEIGSTDQKIKSGGQLSGGIAPCVVAGCWEDDLREEDGCGRRSLTCALLGRGARRKSMRAGAGSGGRHDYVSLARVREPPVRCPALRGGTGPLSLGTKRGAQRAKAPAGADPTTRQV